MLLDPYAPLIAGRQRFAQRDEVEQFQEKVGGPMRMWLVAESVPERNRMDTAKTVMHFSNAACCCVVGMHVRHTVRLSFAAEAALCCRHLFYEAWPWVPNFSCCLICWPSGL